MNLAMSSSHDAMNSFMFTAESEADTARLGRVLANILPRGSVVALMGPLGAGKTRLVGAIAAELGVPREVAVSPTFVLIHEYRQGRIPVFHFDAYRLRDADEFAELGPEEYFYGEGICLVEWADRVIECLPAGHLQVEIEVADRDTRRFTLTSAAAETKQLIAKIGEQLARHDPTEFTPWNT
jgi:tRNA threonylcarbamoyladenosine biosynthesis protein TsaE